MTACRNLNISIDQEFHAFIPTALLRMRYIYPGLEFAATEQGLMVEGAVEVDRVRLERDVTYQIYREKIFQQTMPMRQSLYRLLAG